MIAIVKLILFSCLPISRKNSKGRIILVIFENFSFYLPNARGGGYVISNELAGFVARNSEL